MGFAVAGNASGWWFLAEIVQAVARGAVGLLGLRGSPQWLAAAWVVHPLWDVLLHYLGAGHAFAPESWAISCVSFDLTVAAYIAIAYGLRFVGGNRLQTDAGVLHRPEPMRTANSKA